MNEETGDEELGEKEPQQSNESHLQIYEGVSRGKVGGVFFVVPRTRTEYMDRC